jgi:hypothetical protein
MVARILYVRSATSACVREASQRRAAVPVTPCRPPHGIESEWKTFSRGMRRIESTDNDLKKIRDQPKH